MQIDKVKVFKAKTFQHFVQLFGGDVFAVFIRPKFTGNPDAVARNAAVLDGLSYAALVAVSVGGVNVTVAGLQSGKHAAVSGFACRDGIDAKAELGNYDAVVKGKGCLVHG